MRRIQFLLIAAFATTAFVACDDSDDPPAEEIDCNDPANADHADCKDDTVDCEDPANADHADCQSGDSCEADFVLPEPAVDLCANASDIAAYGAVEDITTIATNAALGCGAMEVDSSDAAAMAALVACAACEVSAETNVSPECSSCVADVVACAAANCLGVCAAGGGSDECLSCREEHGCDERVEACQGDMTGSEEDEEDEGGL